MAGTDATDYAPYHCNLELLADFLMNQHYNLSFVASEYGFYPLPLRSKKTILNESFDAWREYVKWVRPYTRGVGCYAQQERNTSVYFCVFELNYRLRYLQ
ncbi:hypothetical protein OESDEN_18789 [Oesophagostomum dentatum]|uniref:Uncharacterized protein n=1 Tax=Oesophagostomum dentatum TaxID=61180 RepID=A0A0B1SE74_OESDE|nr:hypothetical protein OESDEN_18789 [Oesophagostomum dentatum]